MNFAKRSIVTAAGAVALTLVTISSASAHHCTNVEKKAGAGSIGTYNIMTESFTPNQPNGAFITITDGMSFSYDVFHRQMLPEGALAAGPGGDDACDGQRLEDALACLGISE